jgi:hypothetical protein
MKSEQEEMTMQLITTNTMTYVNESRKFVAEVSDFNGHQELVMGENFWLGSHVTGEMVEMVFVRAITDQAENELLGWEYEPFLQTDGNVRTADCVLVTTPFSMTIFND